MNKYFLFIKLFFVCSLLLTWFSILGQPYNDLHVKEYYDDQEEYQTDPSLFTPFNSCAKGDLLERMAGKLESFIIMYKTTGDKSYLYKCIQNIQFIQSLRGTFSGDFKCGLNSGDDGYEAVHDHGSKNWTPRYYQNGLIIWPMAHFVYLVKQEHQFLQSLRLNPLPCSGLGQPCLDLSTPDYLTFGDFANWLSDRVDETLTYAVNNYWYSDSKGFGDHQNPDDDDAPMSINMQSAFGATLLYMGLAWDPAYLVFAKKMAELYKSTIDIEDHCTGFPCSPLTYNHPVLRINNVNNSYWWYHSGWRVTKRECGCSPITKQPNMTAFIKFYEELSHGSVDMIFPFVAYKTGLSSSNNVHFTNTEMVRFRNALAKNAWKGSSDPLNFWNTLIGDGIDGPIPFGNDNNEIPIPNFHNIWSLAYMPLYKFDVYDPSPMPLYDILMNYYNQVVHGKDINNTLLLRERPNLYLGLSEVVCAQWDKECPNLTLKNRKVVYDQDFFSQNDLIVDPAAPNEFDPSNQNSFADPVITTDEFTIEPGVTVNMAAANRIVLKPGAHAKLGSKGRGYIDPSVCAASQCKTGNAGSGGKPGSGTNENVKQETEPSATDTVAGTLAQADTAGSIFPDYGSVQTGISIHPNPATGGELVADITGNEGEEVLVVVTDLLGVEHYSKVIILSARGGSASGGEGGNERYLLAIDPYGKLAAGVYMVIATSRNAMYRKKIVVQ